MAIQTRTAKKIIEGSLRALGVFDPVADDLENEQNNNALEALNDILSYISIDPLLTLEVQESFTLSSGTADYTMGSGATFDTDRPEDVTGGYIRQGGVDHYLKARTRYEWQRVCDKDASGLPKWFYYDPAYPNGTIHFNTAPTANDTVYLDLVKPEAEITSTNTVVTLPPAYLSYLKYSLAVSIAPEYEVSNTRQVEGLAQRWEDRITAMNIKAGIHEPDPALTGTEQTARVSNSEFEVG